MDYKQWNYRGISFFKEEVDDGNYPSIKLFQQKGLYQIDIRNKLCDYLENCPNIATSYKRFHAYTFEEVSTLSYFTDGDFIFTNLLKEYIYYDDFVLPQRWYELIRNRNYINDIFELNHEKIFSGEVDIFDNLTRSFDQSSVVKEVIP